MLLEGRGCGGRCSSAVRSKATIATIGGAGAINGMGKRNGTVLS